MNTIGETRAVGDHWPSPEGTRTIIRIDVDPRSGGRVYFVSTEGSPMSEIVLERNLEQDIRRDTNNYESRSKAKGKELSDEKLRLELESWLGFTGAMSPPAKGRAHACLAKIVFIGGNPGQRGMLIFAMVQAGWRVENWKTGRVLKDERGSFFTEKDLTKTGLDFAEYLVLNGLH